MRSLFAVIVSVSIAAFLLPSLAPENPQSSFVGQKIARDLAVTDPVAVIDPLPDEVSNGTWWRLNATNSSYSRGTIVAYHWDIEINDVHTEIYEMWKDYKFRLLGLYKITLTITTNDSLTAQAFTAVYSILDSDSDMLPDWWELFYFTTMDQTGEMDYDGDGYTNLQEYADNTNPTVLDPGRSIIGTIVGYWYYLAALAAIIAVALLLTYPKLKKRRKAVVKKQIEAALEIEKALEEDK